MNKKRNVKSYLNLIQNLYQNNTLLLYAVEQENLNFILTNVPCFRYANAPCIIHDACVNKGNGAELCEKCRLKLLTKNSYTPSTVWLENL